MATGAGKEKRRRIHSTDRRESPNKTNILQTVVTPGGTFAGTEVLGSTPGKAYRKVGLEYQVPGEGLRAYLESAHLK